MRGIIDEESEGGQDLLLHKAWVHVHVCMGVYVVKTITLHVLYIGYVVNSVML